VLLPRVIHAARYSKRCCRRIIKLGGVRRDGANGYDTASDENVSVGEQRCGVRRSRMSQPPGQGECSAREMINLRRGRGGTERAPRDEDAVVR